MCLTFSNNVFRSFLQESKLKERERMMDKEQRAKIHQEMMQRKSHPYADIKGKPLKMSKQGFLFPSHTGRPVPPSGYQNHILIFSTSVFANQYSKLWLTFSSGKEGRGTRRGDEYSREN